MKKFRNITLTAMVALLFMGITSCDKVKDLTEKDVNVEFGHTTPLLTLTSDDAMTYEGSVSIDTPELHQYMDNIKSVKITKFTYQIVDFNDGEDFCTVTAQFYSGSIDFGGEKINLKSANDNKKIFEITNVNGLNQLASKLKHGDNVPLGVKCTPEEFNTGAKFKVKINIKAIVTVGL